MKGRLQIDLNYETKNEYFSIGVIKKIKQDNHNYI